MLEPVAVLLDRTKREQSERWGGVLLHAMSNGKRLSLRFTISILGFINLSSFGSQAEGYSFSCCPNFSRDDQ